jgi:lysophospholipase L1-like esterase
MRNYFWIQRSLLIFFLTTILPKVYSQEKNNSNFSWYNYSSSSTPSLGGQEWQNDQRDFFNRFPNRAEKNIRNVVWGNSINCAGEYLDFKTNASTITIRYTVSGEKAMQHMPATGVSGVDLYNLNINGSWEWARAKATFGDTIEYRFSNLSLSATEEEFRLYLPLYNHVKWMSVGIPADKIFTPLPSLNELPIIIYGTSITQGACASRPGLAWSNILERNLDIPIINLGFSGTGQLDSSVIDLINEKNARLYVLDCLGNLARYSHFSDEEITHRILHAVTTLRSRHPSTPVLLVENSGSMRDISIDTSVSNDFQHVDSVAAHAIKMLKEKNITGIYVLTSSAIGLDKESTVDGIHPNDIGMMKYAQAYETIIRKILHEEKGTASTTVPIRQRRDYATYDFISRHRDELKFIKEHQPEIALIGNSITHFWGGEPESTVKNGPLSWEKYMSQYKIVNMGFGWDRIENVLWRVYHGELDGFTPEKIFLCIGSNNLAVNSNEEIIEGLSVLLKAIRSKQPKARLYLSGLYPRRNYESRIDSLNKTISNLAQAMHLDFINPGILLVKPDKHLNEKMFREDGVHPNDNGYAEIGKYLQAYLKQQ